LPFSLPWDKISPEPWQEGVLKEDLQNQRKALEEFCIAHGLVITEWLSDIGSGLNYTRKNFIALM
jgi:predicted site-specific integrase-resolvase